MCLQDSELTDYKLNEHSEKLGITNIHSVLKQYQTNVKGICRYCLKTESRSCCISFLTRLFNDAFSIEST
jgi:hypothetical protein